MKNKIKIKFYLVLKDSLYVYPLIFLCKLSVTDV